MAAIRFTTLAIALAAAGLGGVAAAESIESPTNQAIEPSFDILSVEAVPMQADLSFRMTVRGEAGAQTPAAERRKARGEIYAYIWPMNVDTVKAGFPPGQGLLAIALVNHPDFDDGPALSRNSEGWHSHWFVLVPDKACGSNGLKVKEMAEDTVKGSGLPVMTSAPDFPVSHEGSMAEVRVPRALLGDMVALRFDGLTASLQMSDAETPPFMCISQVFDVASKGLTLSGTVSRGK